MFEPPQKKQGCGRKKTEGTSTAMFDVGTVAKCYEFKRYVLQLDSMLRELRELLICNKHGPFSWESGDRPPCWPRDSTVRRKKHGCEQKRKTEGTSSAMFGVGTGAKCYRTGELKRCADRVRSRTQETESPQRQISVCNLNFSPSTFTV